MTNEITVRIDCPLKEMYNILKNKGFVLIDKYNLEDIYYIPKDIDVKKQNIEKILKKCILIRKVIQFIPDDFIESYNVIKLTLKNKNIASDGTIISQDKSECEIKDIKEGKKFIKALGYKELMTINEKAVVYCKDELKLVIKNVKDIDNLIELETVEDNIELDTIDKLKEKINKLQIPINTDDYFVKKAELKLKKIL